MLGDSVTTDHISPAGSIPKDGPAGRYLIEHGVEPRDFNSFGARRGNHEVMMRGTFGNVRLRNELVRRQGRRLDASTCPTGARDAHLRRVADAIRPTGTPLVIIAGKEYGSGSSRDWAAKGTLLLGVKAVIAESYERIHRSNLVGMGVLPLQFKAGESRTTLGLDGREVYAIQGIADARRRAPSSRCEARRDDGSEIAFNAHRARRQPDRGRLPPPRRHSADGPAQHDAGLSAHARMRRRGGARLVLVARRGRAATRVRATRRQSARRPRAWLAARRSRGQRRRRGQSRRRARGARTADAAARPGLDGGALVPARSRRRGAHESTIDHDRATTRATTATTTHGGCNDHVVIAAATALGAIGGAAVPPLLARLRDRRRARPHLRRATRSHACGRAAAPALLAALDDPDPRIRVAVVGRDSQHAAATGRRATGDRGPPRPTPTPTSASRPPTRSDTSVPPQCRRSCRRSTIADAAVRASAASALRLIGPPARDRRARSARPSRRTPAARVRLNAAAALAAIGADDAATVRALARCARRFRSHRTLGAVHGARRLGQPPTRGRSSDARHSDENARAHDRDRERRALPNAAS